MKITTTLICFILCLLSFELYSQNNVIWTNLHNLSQNNYGLRYDSTHAAGSTPESKYGSASSLNCLQQLDTGCFWFTIDSVTTQHTLYGFSLSNYIFTDIAGNNFPDGQPGTFPGLPFYIDISGGYAHVYDQESEVDSFAITSGDVIKIEKIYYDYTEPEFGGYLNVYQNGSLASSTSYCDRCDGQAGFNLYVGVVVERNGGGIDPVQCSFGTFSTFGLYDYSITWDSSTFVSAETDTLTVKNSGDFYDGYGISANKLQGTANGYVQYQVVGIDSGSGLVEFGLLSFKDYSHLGNENYFAINGGILQIYGDGSLYGNFGTVALGDILEIVRYGGTFYWFHNGEYLADSYNMFDEDSPTGDGDYGLHAFFQFYGERSFFNITSNFSFPLDTPVITATTSGYCSGSGSPFILSVSNPQSWIHYKWYKNGTAIANTDSSTHTESSPPSATTTYQAKIFDKYGDTLSSNLITITVGPIVLSSHLTNVACYGGSTGIDSIFATNGAGSYTYSWSPSGGTHATASSLAAGSYTVTVTDIDGCTATKTDAITQPSSALSASITGSTNVSCHSGTNGTATVSASGGTTSYTYSWSPSGGTNTTASGLATGTYTVTVTDAHSCSSTATVTITQPSVLSASITSSTNISCYGGSNGSATVSASGGTTSYAYLWSPSGGTNTTTSSLAAATYTVTITDAHSCTTSATITITQPAALAASVTSSTNVTCYAASTGAATLSPSGGTPPYTYSWSPIEGTDSMATALAAGTYSATVTDVHGCTATDTVTINLALHNSCNSAIVIDPKNIYTNYSVGDSIVWFSFIADTSALNIKIINSFNPTDTPFAQLQSATLYAGTCDSLTFLNEWDAATDSGSTQINVNYSPLFVDSVYYIKLSRESSVCATLAVTADYLIAASKTCGSECSLVGDGDFSQYTGCPNSVNPFDDCVPCWTCSHGSPQMDTTATGEKHAVMWASGPWNDTLGEGIQNTLYDTLEINNPAVMYMFHIRYRQDSAREAQDSITSPLPCTIHADLTTYKAAGAAKTYPFTCNDSAGGHPPRPQPDTDDTIMSVNNSTFSWTTYTSCISPTSDSLQVLWIYPTTDSPFVWVNVDSVQIYKIDADLGGPAITVCDSAELKPISCPPPYDDLTISYLWSTGATTDSIKVKPDTVITTYWLKITCEDSQGGSCFVSDTIRVNPTDSFSVSITPTPTVICSNNNKGTLYAHPSGSGYSYQWYLNGDTIHGATTDSLLVTATTGWQTDSVVVTNGYCTGSFAKQFRIAPNPVIMSSYKETCFSGDTATATILIDTLWQGNYKYQWYEGSTTDAIRGDTDSTATGLKPGVTYIVEVNDSNLCTAIETIIFGPKITITDIDADCDSSGWVNVTALYGSGNYSYLWNTGATSQKDSGLAAGSYTVTVTDTTSGCSTTASKTLNNNFTVTATATPTYCLGRYTGSVIAKVTGGDSTFTYIWSTGDTIANDTGKSDTLPSLGIGTYSVTVISGTTCRTTKNATVGEDSTLIQLTSGDSIVCGGKAWVIVLSGDTLFHYHWSTGQDTTMHLKNDTISGFADTVATYTDTVTVTDVTTGCIAIAIIHGNSYKLPDLSVTFPDTIVCPGTTVVLTAQGATHYLWSTTSTSDTTASQTIYTYLFPDISNTVSLDTTFTVTGTGANGCKAADSVKITLWPALRTPTLTALPCNNYCIRLNAPSDGFGGTPPYRIQWFKDTVPFEGDSLHRYDSLLVNQICGLTDTGNYNIAFIDTNGCNIAVGVTLDIDSLISHPVNIIVNPTTGGYCSGYGTGIILSAGGGVSYIWSNSDTTSSITATTDSTAIFTVTGTDGSGCTATATASVTVNDTCCTNTGEEISYSNDTLSGTYGGSGMTLNSSVVVPSNRTVTFSGLDLYIDDEVAIIVDSGAKLVINDSSHLQACHNMWSGIIVQSGGKLLIGSSIIEDAQYAIEAQNGSYIYASYSTFNNDYAGIYVPHNALGNTLKFQNINNCEFTCSSHLKHGYAGQTPDPLSHPFAGIYINDLNVLTLPNTNTFDSLNHGIYAINSNLFVGGGSFTNIQAYDAYGLSMLTLYPADPYGVFEYGAGIYARGIGSRSLTFTGNGIGSIAANFDNCGYGIYTDKMNATITKAKITDLTYYGIRIDNGTGLTTNVSNNDISTAATGATAVQTGIMLYLNNSTLGTSVNGNYVNMQNPSAQASYGIHVGGYPASSAMQPLITNNYIYMANAKRAFGITLSTVEQHIASGNNIYFNKAGTSVAAYGIYAGGSPNTSLLCNNIYGQSNNNLIQTGRYSIYSFGSTNYTYACDSVDSTYEGIHFEGASLGTLQAIKFNHHYYGLNVSSSAAIGAQIHQGNLWHILFSGSQLGAFDMAPSDIFIYYPSSLKFPENTSLNPSYAPLSLFRPLTDKADEDCTTNDTCH